MLGYEVYKDDRDFTQAGLTGEVTKYPTSTVQYPCYIIASAIPKFKLEVLNSMINSINVEHYDADFLATRIYVYISLQDKLYKIGQIYAKQVKSFLSLFEKDNVFGYINENTKIENMYLYTLSN